MSTFKTLSYRFKALGFDSYGAYLKSEHWQKMRKKYKRSSRPQYCWCCGGDEGQMDLHHKTYKRLGREKLTDLILVCSSCHDKLHKRVKDKEMWLYTAASVLRAENIRNDIYKADVTRNTKAWKGVDVTFVDPERSRNSGAR